MMQIRWLTLALSLSLLAGCTANPNLIKTQEKNIPGETYGENSNPAQFVPSIPLGGEVAIPKGKAAMTIYVVIPQKKAEGDRQVQYIDFSAITKVEVTITGENLTNPVSTSIDVSSGSSAAGTVVLAAGRNQIITAVGKDSGGNIISMVKGVATSEAGKVADAVAKFGTTPLANVIAGLDATIAPQIKLSAISGVIDPIINPSISGGVVSYSTHPLFINPTPIIQAVHALISEGKEASGITTQDINSKLSGGMPIFSKSTVTVRLRDPNGIEFPLPSQNGVNGRPVDNDCDQVPDGASVTNDGPGLNCYLSDPLTGSWNYISSGYSSIAISSVPPGEYSLSFSYSRVATKPWWVLPLKKPVVEVNGTSQDVFLELIDVSKEISLANGSFSVRNHEWRRFPTEPNLVYKISHNGSSMGTVYAFDQNGMQLYQKATDIGSYTFASPNANCIYLSASGYTLFSVATESLGVQSLYNANIHFAQ